MPLNSALPLLVPSWSGNPFLIHWQGVLNVEYAIPAPDTSLRPIRLVEPSLYTGKYSTGLSAISTSSALAVVASRAIVIVALISWAISVILLAFLKVLVYNVHK